MTILEKSSKRKVTALKKLTDNGEYSAEYSLKLLEDYHDSGKIIDSDYEELAEYLEELINREILEENSDKNKILESAE